MITYFTNSTIYEQGFTTFDANKTVSLLTDSRGNCKNTVGNRDGSKEMEKDRSTTLVDTGKPESKGSGTDAQISSVRLAKTSLIPLKVHNLKIGMLNTFLHLFLCGVL